ncbi:hypothetical protein [Streptomyces xanthophaeus]|uniref:Uncharacterized protein n=2 Tax=Streptomyces xanthophaeus TaxID=67385 RepID=A0A919LCM4_9ACTN|nr:hypothetical protein [Streptomyces xanthophaeus]GHI86045.1 hypothetical protein Sxan_34090 [Streptomyces xanthophaeus]
MPLHTQLRTAAIGACTAALLAGSGLLALPVQAQGQQPAAAASARTGRAEMQVASFFQEYEFATEGKQGEGKSNLQLREEFLTTELDEALTVWGSEHQADPVFREQEMPKSYSTAEGASTATHTRIILTENWADGTSQQVWYQVRLSDLLIDGLTDAPAE